ncbi:MAG: hypothetical protein ACYCZX_14945 [Rhodospirillaceae bacterium]
MKVGIIKRLIAVFLAVAFLSVTFGQVALSTGQPHSSMKMAGMTGHDMSMPCCKDKMPPCMNELGCIFMVSLPAQPTPAAVQLVWSSVDYWTVSQDFRGRTPAPNLKPPKRFV